MVGQTKIRIHKKTIGRFKERVRELTDRNCGKSMAQIIYKLNLYLKGWWNYYSLSEARYIFKSLNGWIIRRLRCLLWKQWKNPRTKIRNLLKRGISHWHAVLCGNARKKHWRMSRVICLINISLILVYSCLEVNLPDQPNRRIRDPFVRWCGRGA